MGKLSRSKGRAFEQYVARELTESTGAKHQRVLTEARDGNSGDVVCPDLWTLYQCKVGARPNVRQAVEEVAAAAWDHSYLGVAAVKWDGGFQIAALTWDDWVAVVDLIARAQKAGLYL